MKHTIATALLLTLSAFGCATPSQYVAKDLVDTKMTVKGQIGNQTMGLNDKDEVVLQEETTAQDELRVQDVVNQYNLEKLRNEAAELKRCRKDMADTRLGGSGILPDDPDVDDLAPRPAMKEQFGKDEEGNLKFVRRGFYMDRLKAARAYEVTLTKLLKVITRHHEECEFKMTAARNKAGLPGQRYMAEGYFTEQGKWVEARKGENSLTDGFEIQANSH